MTSIKSKASYKKLGDVERRPPGSRVHFCTLCDMPIAVYGRLHPCKHVYCMACKASIGQVERIQRDAATRMFVSPATLQGFTDKQEFLQHAKQVGALAAINR